LLKKVRDTRCKRNKEKLVCFQEIYFLTLLRASFNLKGALKASKNLKASKA